MRTIFFINVFFLLLADQASKIYVRANLPIGKEYPFIEGFITFLHVENKGVSFGFLSNLTGIWEKLAHYSIIVLTSAVLIFFIYWTMKQYRKISFWEKTAAAMVIAGGVGNNIDRIIFGKVTDFTYFKFFGQGFFINNVADDFISVGFTIMVFCLFFQKDSHLLQSGQTKPAKN